MFRKLLVVAAALAASACSYGSAVDMAPFKDRPARPVVAEGTYCGVAGLSAPYAVKSSEDCFPLKWEPASRSFLMPEDDKDLSKTVPVGLAPLGDGLYLAQTVDKDGSAPFEIQLLVISGNAFGMISALDDEHLSTLAARHAEVTWITKDKRPVIAKGDRADIRQVLREAAREALKIAKADAAKSGKDVLSIGVLDTRGGSDHPASPAQVKDIEAVKRIAAKLTQK